MADVKPKRAYQAGRRREQAAATRQSIVEAARKLFVERGYSGATVEAIAAEAGVAAVTIYATFGSKRSLLSRLLEVSVVGDERPVALLDRQGPQAVRHETDQRRQVAMFAADIAAIMERVSPIVELMRNAAPSEPDIGELLTQLYQRRLQGMRFFVDAVAGNGPLKAGVSREAAAETVWALSSPDLHRLLTTRLGWDSEGYTAWLRDTVRAAILPG